MARTRKVSHHKRHHIKSKNLKRTHRRKSKLVKKRKTRKNTKKRRMKGGGFFDTIKGLFSRKSEEPQSLELPEPETIPETIPETTPETEEELVIKVTDEELDEENKRLLTNLENKIEELKKKTTEEDEVLSGASGWDDDMQTLADNNNIDKKTLEELEVSLKNETYKTTKEKIQKKRNEQERRDKMSDYEKWQEDNPNSDPQAYFGGKRRRRKRRKTKKGTKH
jgi:hypothetical protein